MSQVADVPWVCSYLFIAGHLCCFHSCSTTWFIYSGWWSRVRKVLCKHFLSFCVTLSFCLLPLLCWSFKVWSSAIGLFLVLVPVFLVAYLNQLSSSASQRFLPFRSRRSMLSFHLRVEYVIPYSLFCMQTSGFHTLFNILPSHLNDPNMPFVIQLVMHV